MKIRDVEELTGLDRKNIYYYEKEGLLNPKRNEENNYREYNEEDVEVLKKIKLLRVLDISMSDIKLLNTGNTTLQEVTKKRLQEFKTIQKNVERLQEVCKVIIKEDITLENLNGEIFLREKLLWRERLQEIAKKDIVKENIKQKELIDTVCKLLLWGYLVNIIVSVLYGTVLINRKWEMLEYEEYLRTARISNLYNAFVFFLILCGLMMLCGIGIHCTSSIKWLIILFNISAIILSPLIIEMAQIIEYSGICTIGGFEGKDLAIYWGMVFLYVMLLYILSLRFEKLFIKSLYALLVLITYSIVCVIISFLMKAPFIFSMFFVCALIYISLIWKKAVVNRERCNKYYAIVTSCKIINIFAHTYRVTDEI